MRSVIKKYFNAWLKKFQSQPVTIRAAIISGVTVVGVGCITVFASFCFLIIQIVVYLKISERPIIFITPTNPGTNINIAKLPTFAPTAIQPSPTLHFTPKPTFTFTPTSHPLLTSTFTPISTVTMIITPTPQLTADTPTRAPPPPPSATPPPPTMPPSPTPNPDFNLMVSPTKIHEGQCVDLSWTVVGVREAYLLGEGLTGPSGNENVCLDETTTYELLVILQDGKTVIRQVTVEVIPKSDDPDLPTPMPQPAEPAPAQVLPSITILSLEVEAVCIIIDAWCQFGISGVSMGIVDLEGVQICSFVLPDSDKTGGWYAQSSIILEPHGGWSQDNKYLGGETHPISDGDILSVKVGIFRADVSINGTPICQYKEPLSTLDNIDGSIALSNTVLLTVQK